ncbi:hypothetical protein [Streptomyces sp. NPDC001594]|uniref:hypothetical protein n=1 Tax=Streptomyces sp. NPDC001594 TaxID=3364590 RepID=UPI0036A04AE1
MSEAVNVVAGLVRAAAEVPQSVVEMLLASGDPKAAALGKAVQQVQAPGFQAPVFSIPSEGVSAAGDAFNRGASGMGPL